MNDPIYGKIIIYNPLIIQIIKHPFFERLKNICQMGLSYLVFPETKHNRYEHAIGTIHLMQNAIKTLRNKGIRISEEEENAMQIATLLHDIGHGPFSHALENSIVGINHETISILLMQKLNEVFDQKLNLAIAIFRNKYHRKFMYQLVSSQLDIDRLDYLKRDSFYCKNPNGNVNAAAIIKSITVVNDELLFEEDSALEIEKILLARKLMYENVYLHKTSLVAELILTKVLNRAKELVEKDLNLEGNENFLFFIKNKINESNFDDLTLNKFTQLTDIEIVSTIREWQNNPDLVLSSLSKMLNQNSFLEITMQNEPFNSNDSRKTSLNEMEYSDYFMFDGKITIETYNKTNEPIKIWTKDKKVENITVFINPEHLTPINKYYICYPKQNKIEKTNYLLRQLVSKLH